MSGAAIRHTNIRLTLTNSPFLINSIINRIFRLTLEVFLMLFNRNLAIIMLTCLISCAAQPAHGMSYLRSWYTYTKEWWYGSPAEIAQKFPTLIQTDKIRPLIPLAQDSAYAPTLAKLSLEHFATLIQLYSGTDLLWHLAQKPENVEPLAQACIKHFVPLIKSPEGLWFLIRLKATENKSMIQPLISLCKQHLDIIMQSYLADTLLEELIKNDDTLAVACAQNFDKLMQSGSGRSLLRKLVKIPAAIPTLADFCNDYCAYLCHNGGSHFDLLKDLARDKSIAQTLIKEQFDTLNATPEGAKLLKELCSKHYASMREIISEKLINHYSLEKHGGQSQLPTITHLSKNIPALETTNKFHTNPLLKPILANTIAKEKKFQDDYYTFVHGQRRELYLPEKLYTHLWQLKKKQSLNDFFFAHVKDLVESPDAITYDKIQKNFILSHGNYDSYEQTEARLKLLFMNYALFANNPNTGSNSASYVLTNSNSPAGSRVNITLDNVFKIFGYEAIYDKSLREKLENLASQYKNTSPYGNLLLIAVPKHKIHKYVYVAEMGGPKSTVKINGIGETSDIRIIMDTLINAPEKIKNTDELQFCLVMMQKKGGLDPNTGIKIIPILSGTPKRLEELKKKEDELFQEIKQKVEELEHTQHTKPAALTTNTVHGTLHNSDSEQMARAYQRAAIILNHLNHQ